MTPDTAPLDERYCLHLLARTSIGRVVSTVGALPAVHPVRYRLDGDSGVLLRAPPGPSPSGRSLAHSSPSTPTRC